MPRSTDQYRDKRDFDRTPEPRPGKAEPRPAGAPARFVIHRHEASSLHYDLRLEMEGVLKSWAVPRGFSFDTKERRLAVRTEDHPIEYLEFSGVIPKGEYGAGTMTIWDHGHYEIAKGADGLAGIADGKLEVVLRGRRLRGEWHMVLPKGKDKEWLLIKVRDRYTRGSDERTFTLDLSDARPAPFPRRVRRMQPGEQAEPFSDPGWLFEMKFVGERVLASRDEDGVHVRGENGRDRSAALERIAAELERVRAERFLLDGVLVALDETQRPSRELLETCLRQRDDSALYLYCFDLLYYEEWDVRGHPLLERKNALASLLPRQERVLYTDHVQGNGEELCGVVADIGLPGVIAKELRGGYVAGAAASWCVIPVGEAVDAESDAADSDPDEGDDAAGDGDEGILDVLARRRAASGERSDRVQLTKLDKVFWPDQGITKGELIDYYDQVSEWILPYLHDRPVHLNRFPDGITGESFYQKNLVKQVPDWIETVQVKEQDDGDPVRYLMCNDRDTLLYLAQLGSIDLHPWHSRRDHLEYPDWAVLDLDPHGAPFAHVKRIARSMGTLLHGIGLRPFLKTSGSTGLHIYIPVPEDTLDYEQVRMFSEMIARLMVREHGDIATVERSTRKRDGKVYVDFLQNRRGQTLVPPYVARPVPAASVSVPLDWDELRGDVEPGQFTMPVALERLARFGDLFRGALDDPQDLLAALEKLGEQLGG